MKERNTGLVDSARRLAELRKRKEEPTEVQAEDVLDIEPEENDKAFSTISADRQQKQMVEFRFLTGNAKALAYSYMVAADFDPSEGICLDFSGYTVTIAGRNLRPLFDGLVAQRVAVVREMDDLQSEVNLPTKETVVTGISITEVE